MAADPGRQERLGTVFMAAASVFIAVMEFLSRPAPGEFVEADPDWYVAFNVALHGLILFFLLFALVRLPRMTAETPALRLPFAALVLVGIAGAAYVLGGDLGLM